MMGTRRVILGLGASAAALAFAGPASAQTETIKLTIAASHPTTIAWIGYIQSFFQPEVNRRLEAAGSKYRIEWKEAYGGQLYKANATLTSVGDGITDVGWVFVGMEGAKLPLMQVGAATPFTTDDLPRMMEAVNAIHDKVPALRRQWEDNNVVFLGASGNDTYDLYLKQPLKSLAELKGRKLTAPQTLSLWLLNTGAALKEGGLPTYYTDIQTGLADGTIAMATGILPVKVYEVAPYIVRTNIGAIWSGALAVNRDRWQKLPPDVQKAMQGAGAAYSLAHAEEVMRRAKTATEKMIELGAGQSPKVQVIEFPEAERKAWATSLPNIAQDWAKRNGKPGEEVLAAYMAAMRSAGAKPLRDWDK